MAAWKEAFGAANVERELEEYVSETLIPGCPLYIFRKARPVRGPGDAAGSGGCGSVSRRIPASDGATGGKPPRVLPQQANSEPENVRLQTVLALDEIARGEYEKANLRLLSIGNPTDWLIAYRAAAAIAEIVERGGSAGASQVDAARRLFELSRQQRGDMANALARLSMLELKSAAGPSKETRTAIERAQLLAAGREDYVFIHAQVLARLSEFKAARQISRTAAVHGLPSGDPRHGAQPHGLHPPARKRRKAEGRNVRSKSLPILQRATQPPIPPSAPSDGELKPSDPATASGTAFSAGYRRLQAGEQRLARYSRADRMRCRRQRSLPRPDGEWQRPPAGADEDDRLRCLP